MTKEIINLFDQEDQLTNHSPEYAALLEQYVAPFKDRISDEFEMEDLFEMGCVAWNLANMKLLSPELYQEMYDLTVEDLEDLKMLDEMIVRKESSFKEHGLFLVDVYWEDNDELVVITKNQEEFIEESLAQQEESIKTTGFINRLTILVEPKKKYFDWLNALYPDEEPISKAIEPNGYLIQVLDTEVDDWLKDNFDEIFEKELDNWHMYDEDWPKERTYKMFCEWFSVKTCPMVYDFVDQPIFKDPS